MREEDSGKDDLFCHSFELLDYRILYKDYIKDLEL